MMHFVYNKVHMKRYIELNTWKRKDHFSFFSQYEIPRFNMTFDLDVTKLYQWAKNENVSFYLACTCPSQTNVRLMIYLKWYFVKWMTTV